MFFNRKKSILFTIKQLVLVLILQIIIALFVDEYFEVILIFLTPAILPSIKRTSRKFVQLGRDLDPVIMTYRDLDPDE
jgi:hypothetical protein